MSDTHLGDCSFCREENIDLADGQERSMCVGCREEMNDLGWKKHDLERFAMLKAAEPLIAFLKNRHNPHKIVIVSCDSVELLSGELNIPNVHELMALHDKTMNLLMEKL